MTSSKVPLSSSPAADRLSAYVGVYHLRRIMPSGLVSERYTKDWLEILTWLKTEFALSFGSEAQQALDSLLTNGAPSSTEQSQMPSNVKFTYHQQVDILKQDLLAKFNREDWHGVADAAMDLRDLIAFQKGLRVAVSQTSGVSNEKEPTDHGGAIGRFPAGDR